MRAASAPRLVGPHVLAFRSSCPGLKTQSSNFKPQISLETEKTSPGNTRWLGVPRGAGGLGLWVAADGPTPRPGRQQASRFQITPRDSAASSASTGTRWTRARSASSIRARRRSTSPRKVASACPLPRAPLVGGRAREPGVARHGVPEAKRSLGRQTVQRRVGCARGSRRLGPSHPRVSLVAAAWRPSVPVSGDAAVARQCPCHAAGHGALDAGAVRVGSRPGARSRTSPP